MNLDEKNRQINKDIKVVIAGTILASLFVFLTNPIDMHIGLVLILPILTSIIIYFFTNIILKILTNSNTQQVKGISAAASVFVLTVFLLGSIKQLSFQDFLLILFFVSGAAFYSLRAVKA